jgi:hypothetical protein
VQVQTVKQQLQYNKIQQDISQIYYVAIRNALCATPTHIHLHNTKLLPCLGAIAGTKIIKHKHFICSHYNIKMHSKQDPLKLW